MFNVKSISAADSIIDIDAPKGRIVGYFSKFGNIDSDGDISMPGSFKKTLIENNARQKHLYQHSPFMPLSGTKNGRLILKEDSNGLYFESQISNTSLGKDVIKLYEDGVVDEHSFGFEVIKSEDHPTETVDFYGLKRPVRINREYRLWEGSTVTWGANELAKGGFTKAHLVAKSESLNKAFRNGTYENEELFEMIELYIKQVESAISTLPNENTVPQALKAIDDFNISLLIDNKIK